MKSGLNTEHNSPEQDWNAAQETLYLSSILGMAESINVGLSESVKNCNPELDW